MVDIFLAHLNCGRNVIPNKWKCKQISISHEHFPVKKSIQPWKVLTSKKWATHNPILFDIQAKS